MHPAEKAGVRFPQGPISSLERNRGCDSRRVHLHYFDILIVNSERPQGKPWGIISDSILHSSKGETPPQAVGEFSRIKTQKKLYKSKFRTDKKFKRSVILYLKELLKKDHLSESSEIAKTFSFTLQDTKEVNYLGVNYLGLKPEASLQVN